MSVQSFRIFTDPEAQELLLELGEAPLLLPQCVLKHDPAVDQVRRREDVEERAVVGGEPCQAGLGRLRAVGVALPDVVEVLPQAAQQLERGLAVQLVECGDE